MIALKIIAFGGLAYLIGRSFALHYERENEKLKAKLVVVEQRRKQERLKYEDRIHTMNDAFDQFKKR